MTWPARRDGNCDDRPIILEEIFCSLSFDCPRETSRSTQRSLRCSRSWLKHSLAQSDKSASCVWLCLERVHAHPIPFCACIPFALDTALMRFL